MVVAAYSVGLPVPSATEPAPGVVRDFQMHIFKWLIFAQRERLLEFDPGQMTMCYTATDATLPVFGSWCEHYRVEPEGTTHATIDWTLACAPRYLRRIPGIRWGGARSLRCCNRCSTSAWAVWNASFPAHLDITVPSRTIETRKGPT